MARLANLRAPILKIGVAVAILGAAGLAVSQLPLPPALSSAANTPTGLLTSRIDDATPDAARIVRGQYLVAAGDCMSCHLREGGEPFA